MATPEERLLQFWTEGKPQAALWADSSYAKLSPNDVMKVAKEINFPLASFSCFFGAGLTLTGDYSSASGNDLPYTAAPIVIIEMGYNDDSRLSGPQALAKMMQLKWYDVLRQNSSLVKFVVFVHQPTYKQACEPKKEKLKAKYKPGNVSEGSKFTAEAMRLVQQMGIQTVCLNASAEELFGGMLECRADGHLWQAAAVCRSHVDHGLDMSEDGELALWADGEHPTVEGAKVHFKALVNCFRSRFDPLAPKVEVRSPPIGWGAQQKDTSGWQSGWKPGNAGKWQQRERSRSREPLGVGEVRGGLPSCFYKF